MSGSRVSSGAGPQEENSLMAKAFTFSRSASSVGKEMVSSGFSARAAMMYSPPAIVTETQGIREVVSVISMPNSPEVLL